MKGIKGTTILLVLIFICQGLAAQIDPMQPLPLDESVRYGVLDNGMTYYIKANQEPKERASFYIIQNVGALMEEDHQDGLAHFLEHMAFNGTEHFPDKGIINFLETHGVAFGENINAYTAHNQTVYNLSDVPVNKPLILDTCLLILHDWSNYLLLTEEEIDLERGVIKEEWRTRQSPQMRMMYASLPYLFPNSKFAERTIIGDMDVVENFEYEALRDFYHRWYRTDLQAIAMVGDFDPVEMEQKVRDLFSGIPPVEDAPERPFYEIPDNEEPIFGLVTDKEADQTILRFMIRHQKEDTGPETFMDLREAYVRQLFNNMMDQRIQELVQAGDPPFVIGMIMYSDLERGYEALNALVLPKPNEEARGLRAIMTELERARRYGFTQGELDRAKAEILTNWEKRYNQRDKVHNEEFINDYVDHYLEGDAYLSVEQGFEFVKVILPTITVEEFNGRLNQWATPENNVLLIQGPSGENFNHLTEAEAFTVLEEVASAEIDPYAEEELATSLVEEELEIAPLAGTRTVDPFEATEWTLQNGAKVIFRHADFEKDQMQIRAYSTGGGSLYGDEYVPTVEMTTDMAGYYGLGQFDLTSLQKMLTGKNVSLSLNIGGLYEGLSGSSTPRDFEVLLQLIYLSFEQPRFDEEAHEAFMGRLRAYIQNLRNDPQTIMGDSLDLIMTGYHPRTRILDSEYLDDVNFQWIEEVYRDRFTDASDFFFVIVGNMEADSVQPLVRKYIGAITDTDRSEKWVDREIRQPEGVVRKTIPIAMETPKANVNIVINQDMAYDPYHRVIMQVIEGILDLRYVESIREEEGGTYGVGVSAGLRHWPEERGIIRIGFDCDPGRVEDLKAKVYLELEKLAAEGPTKEDLSKTVENLLKNREQRRQHNSFYLDAIYARYVHGIDLYAAGNYEEILNKLTVKDVQKVMKSIYKDPDIVDVVFIPQEEEAATP